MFDGSNGTSVLVAVAGLTPSSWEVAGFAVAAGPASTQLGAARAWTTQLPLGGSIPSAVAAAGGLAVLELDGRVLALRPQDGSLAWNASSPCSLGRPRPVRARWGQASHVRHKGRFPVVRSVHAAACAPPTAMPHLIPMRRRSAREAVYLICQELSGDSTLIALHPANGTTAWAISSSSVAAALVPVRAAVAAPGALIYADAGSNVTALGAADGALLWQVRPLGTAARACCLATLEGRVHGLFARQALTSS